MSVVDRNANASNLIVLANKMANTTVKGQYGNFDKTSLCTIAHISDLHHDMTRYGNYIDYVKSLGTLVDHAFVTGDLVDVPTSSQYSDMYSVETAKSFSPYKVVGNHEKKAADSYMSNADIYTNLHMNTNTGKLYYYFDDTTYKIRFIVLNLYDIDQPLYKTEHLSQAQIDWFIQTLHDAIENEMDVVIAMHACESNMSLPVVRYQKTFGAMYDSNGVSLSSGGNSFYQRFFQGEGLTDLENVCSGTPIEDIVNAFQHGETINNTYTFRDTGDSIVVNTSFEEAGTFIAYMVGHLHGDYIGQSINYDDQLYLLVCAGYPVYGSTGDLQRKQGEFSEDAFNVYVIDQFHRYVKVVRVGANVNDILERREMALYAY